MTKVKKRVLKEAYRNLSKDEQKAMLKDAIKEASQSWMNDRFAEFGRFSIKALGVMAIVALLYFTAWANGWIIHK